MDSTTTRRGFKITMKYDALGRLFERTLPEVLNTSFFNRWGAYFTGAFNPANVSSNCEKVDRLCPRGASFAIRLDPNFSAFTNVGLDVRGAHELGHMHARMVDETGPGTESEAQAVEAENSVRTIKNCSARTSNEHGNTGSACP